MNLRIVNILIEDSYVTLQEMKHISKNEGHYSNKYAKACNDHAKVLKDLHEVLIQLKVYIQTLDFIDSKYEKEILAKIEKLKKGDNSIIMITLVIEIEEIIQEYSF